MELFRDLLLIFLTFLCGFSMGRMSGVDCMVKQFSAFLKTITDDNKNNEERT